ncbi:ketopantoate reductase family protein [Tersicoccus sp. Bi-70]|uniref:ketopantoate reductase family protein n=1 Tax=Tersicoccus sp. Bi-70 TaxID=1897634 RepID=UPI0009762247|nr:2-dehydropantoate 2-reductase [Tersicoccus sp. Bi-70]OMH35016.1 hypothetical protein BGP79_01340 [Tersicoccus sp. Bi-70]
MTTPTPYSIVGAGAIGGTIAVRLAQAGVPVQVIDADPAHVATIRERGLTLITPTGAHVEHVAAFGLDDAPPTLDRVILAVKSQATAAAMDWIAPRLASDGFVVSLQNGLNEPLIAQRIGADRTVAAFVDLFADVLEPAVIQDGGIGGMALGEYSGTDRARVHQLAADLHAWGTPVVSTNVEGYLWSKLGFGAMLSATALADEDMGVLIDRHRDLMLRLTREVFDVAAHLDVRLEGFDAFRPDDFRRDADPAVTGAAFDDLCAWLATQGKKRSGIWRDIAVRHRPTEVPAHYEPVLEFAERFGVPTPLLRDLVARIGRLERGEATMSEQLLVELGDQRTEHSA